jgi:hypothetical protein
MSLIEMIDALDCVLREMDADQWVGQTRWLKDWKNQNPPGGTDNNL